MMVIETIMTSFQKTMSCCFLVYAGSISVAMTPIMVDMKYKPGESGAKKNAFQRHRTIAAEDALKASSLQIQYGSYLVKNSFLML